MNKVKINSFRLTEFANNKLENKAKELGITKTAVISILIYNFIDKIKF